MPRPNRPSLCATIALICGLTGSAAAQVDLDAPVVLRSEGRALALSCRAVGGLALRYDGPGRVAPNRQRPVLALRIDGEGPYFYDAPRRVGAIVIERLSALVVGKLLDSRELTLMAIVPDRRRSGRTVLEDIQTFPLAPNRQALTSLIERCPDARPDVSIARRGSAPRGRQTVRLATLPPPPPSSNPTEDAPTSPTDLPTPAPKPGPTEPDRAAPQTRMAEADVPRPRGKPGETPVDLAATRANADGATEATAAVVAAAKPLSSEPRDLRNGDAPRTPTVSDVPSILDQALREPAALVTDVPTPRQKPGVNAALSLVRTPPAPKRKPSEASSTPGPNGLNAGAEAARVAPDLPTIGAVAVTPPGTEPATDEAMTEPALAHGPDATGPDGLTRTDTAALLVREPPANAVPRETAAAEAAPTDGNQPLVNQSNETPAPASIRTPAVPAPVGPIVTEVPVPVNTPTASDGRLPYRWMADGLRAGLVRDGEYKYSGLLLTCLTTRPDITVVMDVPEWQPSADVKTTPPTTVAVTITIDGIRETLPARRLDQVLEASHDLVAQVGNTALLLDRLAAGTEVTIAAGPHTTRLPLQGSARPIQSLRRACRQ